MEVGEDEAMRRVDDEECTMSMYWVLNKMTMQEGRVEATNAEEACKKLGWLITDCFVQRD
jgi:hypothetical protein